MCDLAAQQHVALLGDVPRFGKPGLPDHLLEQGPVKLTVDTPKTLVGDDALRDFLIGEAEPQLLGLFVERGFRDQLADQLPVEADGARLIGGDRPAGLSADALELVGVVLAELIDRNFGAADLGDRIRAEAAENIADAPDREADNEAAHDGAHHGLADPG